MFLPIMAVYHSWFGMLGSQSFLPYHSIWKVAQVHHQCSTKKMNSNNSPLLRDAVSSILSELGDLSGNRLGKNPTYKSFAMRHMAMPRFGALFCSVSHNAAWKLQAKFVSNVLICKQEQL